MKFLLLSSNTGEGHNSAARAIAETANRCGIEAEIAESLSIGKPNRRALIPFWYNMTIRVAPLVFSAVYHAGDLYDRSRLPSPFHFPATFSAKKLDAYIREKQFDAVICTHFFGMEACGALKRKGKLTVPTFGILTDYTMTPFFCDAELDHYFLPHEELIPEAIRRGLPAEKISCDGIPVSEKLNHRVGKAAAREMLDIPQDRRVYLVGCGGAGAGNILDLCREILAQDPGDSLILVLAGRNAKLIKKLDVLREATNRVRPVSFTTDVNLYLEAADVMISKSGGLSSTESAVSNIPLVHLQAIPGCETKNARFFADHGLSVLADDVASAARVAKRLTLNPAEAETMRERQREVIPQDASERILTEILGMMGEKVSEEELLPV